MHLQKLLGVVGLLALFSCTTLWSQVSSGAISGSVLDASGSAIANAKVKIVNVDTGLTREVVSDDGGRYIAPQLPVGNYSVEASQTGFQTEVRKGLELTVGRDHATPSTFRPDFYLRFRALSFRALIGGKGQSDSVEGRDGRVLLDSPRTSIL